MRCGRPCKPRWTASRKRWAAEVRLALVIYKFFPYGGLQRDFHRFVLELQQLGHDCRVYCMTWQGPLIDRVDLRRKAPGGIGSARRNQRFVQWLQSDLAQDPVDGVIGFNKVPGLDVYFAGDPCYLEKALNKRGRAYRRSARFRHFSTWERAVFAASSNTQVLLISEHQRRQFVEHYQTPPARLHMLPPGVSPQRRAGDDAPRRRRQKRAQLGLAEDELTLLFVGSGFITKGLDRAIIALAHLRQQQPVLKTRLLVVGQDKPGQFRRLAKRHKVADVVEFLGGRDDVSDLMLAADLLLHPARAEAAGVVLLEALVAGLPVVVSEVCGYAHHVGAARGGVVLAQPFAQERLDKAVMRNIDGVFRAQCRTAALQYARETDLYSMHSVGAKLMVTLLPREVARG